MKLIFLFFLLCLSSCADNNKCQYSYNSGEPTLQSAEDAMKKDFDEKSFYEK